MEYVNPSEFGYDIVMGFKKLAIPAGWEVEIKEISKEMQKEISYDVFIFLDMNIRARLFWDFLWKIPGWKN